MLRAASVLVLVVCAAGLAAACANNVPFDEECTPDSNPDNHGDACPYGPPGGPKISEPQCVTTLISKQSTQCNGLTWAKVYGDLVAPPPTGGDCANDGCHGQANAGGIHLAANDPAGAYNTFQVYVGAEKSPYIDASTPGNSWIVCNVEGRSGGGVPMPPAGLPMALQAEVHTWVACGAPN